MATSSGSFAFDEAPGDRHAVAGLAEAFVFGRPAGRLELIWSELVSLVDLLRAERDLIRPTMGIAIAKLVGLLAIGIVFTSAIVVGVGTLLLRAALSFMR